MDLVAKICRASADAPQNGLVREGKPDVTMRLAAHSGGAQLPKTELQTEAPRRLPDGIVYRFDCPRDAFLIFALFSPRAPVRFALGAAFLRAARFTFLRSSVSVMLFVFAMKCLSYLSRNSIQNLEALQLGELLHQLFHAV